MTASEIKANIVSQLNQQAVATLVDQLAALTVEHEALKAKLAEANKAAPKAD